MSEPKTAEVKVVPSGWRTMESAPRDRTPVRALIHADLYPRVKPGRDDLVRWNGQEIVVHHPGIADDGFDTGWSLSAPVGHGGFPDEWFVGWLPTGLAASPPAETEEGGFGDALLALLYRYGVKVALEVSEIEALRQLALSAQPVSPSEGEVVIPEIAPEFWAWLKERDLCPDGEIDGTVDWRDIITALDEHEVELTHPASDQSDTERMRAWDWLAANPSLELSHGYPGEPEDPGAWMVHRVNGGVNDREWTLIASADTPLDAVVKASAALAEMAADQSAATGEA